MAIETLDGLHVVVEDIRLGSEHDVDEGTLAREVWGQDLDGHAAGFHRLDAGRPMVCALVLQVVAVD